MDGYSQWCLVDIQSEELVCEWMATVSGVWLTYRVKS